MTTLFISDLHLDADRPEIGEQFLAFLETEARSAEALYILGDLFESWVGDDDPNPHYAIMKIAIRALVDSGVPVFFMRGNRDFMIGQQFVEEVGVKLLDDPTPLELFGERLLLSHGDVLCTDDLQYQQVRQMTRDPEWQAMMRAKPLEERLTFAEQARAASLAHHALASEEIMDVNADAVAQSFLDHEMDILVHGHTHRPAVHAIDLPDRRVTRMVLGDWYEQGSVIYWNKDGARLQALPR
jgi:UDP-2,3-diacylglucosamine hydrolase